MKDNFEIEEFKNIDFKGLFNGIVIERDLDKRTVDVFIPEIQSNYNKKPSKKEKINNFLSLSNLIGKKDKEVTIPINSINTITCESFNNNYSNIMPEIGSNVTVFFLANNPKYPYYMNHSTIKKEDNKFISNLKERYKDIDILYVKDNFTIAFVNDNQTLYIDINGKTKKIDGSDM